ncbi:DUF6325 family protein [Microbacterium elymi]|uniref:DUF6325 family protein n=1 Tax=Microbacterium elymi TaxID=2909587 RepID=A0ABY5NLE5_9MICO|nr:DUF6325 family protein [Microbacterium elymi]UUT35906.1 DUF6325 family protein [Microbacterium elymi]
MPEFRYGPVEFYLVGFEGERPDRATLDALVALLEKGAVRLLDFVLISRSESGETSIVEVEDDPDTLELGGYAPDASGLAGDADIAEFAELVPLGGSAALVVLELAFQRELASHLAAAGGVVLATERVPAPVVNAVLDTLEHENEGE